VSLSVFGAYSKYYDLIYAEKNYAQEIEYLCNFIKQSAAGAKDLLELGCGTGIHASLFAEKGYRVTGIDLSTEMLARARERHSSLSGKDPIEFKQADIRNFALKREFDIVVALFHVISYLPTNSDLDAAFSRVRAHLKPGGLFLFDHWYGPAVLSDRPVPRIKKFEDAELKITRVATPTLIANENLVDVRYDFVVFEKSSGRFSELTEMHRMRYLFWPEIQFLLSRHGLRPIAFNKWMTKETPLVSSWNTLVVAAAE
jgi:SAM-dependent methyltransferase